jgi:hypothetical protein
VGRRNADVAEIAGAVARWNVHAAAERDGEMRIVAADAILEYAVPSCGSTRQENASFRLSLLRLLIRQQPQEHVPLRFTVLFCKTFLEKNEVL